ncbi:MAG TPA: DMT family transporter [Terriglobales bacterium]|nr:DMT family transporter [Terriglobales bacterium]
MASTPSVSNSFLAHKTSPFRGYLYIGSATFLWGISATLGRAAFTGRLLPAGTALQPIDPLILSQSRTTFSLLVLMPLLALARGWSRLRLPRRDFFRCLLLGVLGVAASNYLYYLAIQRTNVATAIILQYTAPVWVLLYMVARGSQRATLKRVSAVALAVVGSALAIGVIGAGGFRLDVLGVTAAVAAAFSFAFYNVGGHEILARYDRWLVLLWTLFAASAFWMLVNPPWKIAAAHYSGIQWTFLFVFSLVSVLGPFSLYFAGLQHLEPTRAIVASCLEPVFSIILAAIALGEVMRPIQSLGIVIVLTAIVVVQLPDRGQRDTAALVEPIE